MKELHHILVGIDFSSSSKSALREAIRWSIPGCAPVTALHVIERSTAEALERALGLDEAQLRLHVEGRLKEFIRGVEPVGLWVTPRIEIGRPYDKIEAACKELKTDLLVLGSRGDDHKANQIGVIAAKCLRKAPTDVLLVKENFVGPFHRVLACVDFSETSARAVTQASEAAHFDHAKLDCVYVYPCMEEMLADYGVLGAGFMPEANPASGDLWQKELDNFVAPLTSNGEAQAPHNIVVQGSNVRDTIRRQVESSHAELVVLGTRGKTDLRTLLIGTTAERIVERTPCSVLAVKPESLVESHDHD